MNMGKNCRLGENFAGKVAWVMTMAECRIKKRIPFGKLTVFMQHSMIRIPGHDAGSGTVIDYIDNGGSYV